MNARVALALFLATGCATVEFRPRAPLPLDRAPPPAQSDSSAPALADVMPKAGVTAASALDVAHEAKLSNGVRVLVLEQHAHPIVAVGVVLQRGAAEAAPGLFDLFIDSLASGSDLIEPIALHRNLYDYAVNHRVEVLRESSVVSAQFIAPLLHDVVLMVAPAFVTPSFDAKELDHLLDEHRRKAARSRDEPGARAKRELYRMLFPNGHPYAEDAADGEKPLDGVTRDAIVALRSYVGADDVAVVAAGDVTLASLRPLLEEAMGTLKGPAHPRRTLPEVVPPTSAHVVLLDHPHDTQAQIALGFTGVAYDNPDFPSLYFLSKVLQDAMRASLRLAHGSTYATSGDIRMMHARAPLVLSTAVDTASADDAIANTLATIKNLETQLKREGELDRLKSWVIGNRRFETVDEALEGLTTIAAYDLPADYWAKLRDTITALTPDDLVRVAKTYLDPARAQLVVLGDAVTLSGQLEALGLGNVEVRKIAH